jgi:hypothetical protein
MSDIKISELKTLFNRLIEKLEFEKGKEGKIELKTNIYRLIPTEKWDKFEKPEDWFSASEISQGNLIDDLIELKNILTDKEKIFTYVDFDRLASVLREISQIENPI